jgi:hypothetical protein
MNKSLRLLLSILDDVGSGRTNVFKSPDRIGNRLLQRALKPEAEFSEPF